MSEEITEFCVTGKDAEFDSRWMAGPYDTLSAARANFNFHRDRGEPELLIEMRRVTYGDWKVVDRDKGEHR